MNKSDKPFDPLLFNGLGRKRDRKWNNILYSIFSFINGILLAFGFLIIGGLAKKWYSETWFSLFYAFAILILTLYCLLLLYFCIQVLKHTKANKYINKDNPILVCEYQGSFKNYCVWTLGFLAIFIIYFLFLGLSLLAPPLLASVLTHFYLYKPFLLKRILLFKDYVILEYRIFGNVKISREGLALMNKAPITKSLYLSFVYPMIFNTNKHIFYNKYLIAYFCLHFNKFGMKNVQNLYQELNYKIEYNIDSIISRGHRNWIYAFRYPIKENSNE